MLKKLVLRWLLPKIISRSCDSRIPRSGEEGAKVNCFVVTGYEKDILNGLKWNGERYADKHSISINDLNDGELRITHYYGLSEVIYSNVYDLAWNHLSRIVYLKIHFYRYVSSAHQYFFNKKKGNPPKSLSYPHQI